MMASWVFEKAAVYFQYTKPRVWSLLVFVACIGGIMAAKDFAETTVGLILLGTVATIFGSAGAESITNYIDRMIDSVMERTRNRPLASGRISPNSGLLLGIVLIFLSIIVLLAFSKYIASLLMAVGIFDNVVIYSYLLKRRTPWSIILGGISGGIPVLVGWYTVTNTFSIIPWVLFSLVIIWIPIHVWSLVYRYRDDYKKAGIPMLPAISSDRISAICIASSALLLVVFSILPFIFRFQTVYYLVVALFLAAPMILYSIVFMRRPNRESSFRLFKYSSPYLAMIFVVFLIFRFV